MIFQSDKMPARFVKRGIVLLIGAAVSCVPKVSGSYTTLAGTEGERRCGGLHAGIRAELVRKDPNYTRPAFVMVSFVLLNDAETQINSSDGGWKLIMDGQELSDSGWIFGNGPQPENGWGILRLGESYEFGKELEISRYFSKLGEHTLSWRGHEFQSSTVRINITPQ